MSDDFAYFGHFYRPEKDQAMTREDDIMSKHTLGDAPIESAFHEKMNDLARFIDQFFNEHARGKDRKTGFVLLVFPFKDHDGRCNYISNGADRKDIVTLMKEQIRRFEGQPEMKGHA
jgi:hypothetical protein